LMTWKEWGVIFPILAGVSISYAIWGHHLTGALGHSYIEPSLIVTNLSVGFEGIYGMMLNASANLIFLFIIFGSIFSAVGIDRFFFAVGNFLGRHLRGGSAQTAVFGSALVGMSLGVAPANVALTGSYTIPLMRKTGFKAEHAAAIEAVASTGGQLTPPIMGVAVFIMAGFLGISYSELMTTALVPALIFYITVFLGVTLIAQRENIPMLTLPVNRTDLKVGAPVFIIPMGLIVVLLFLHLTPAYVALIATVALLLVSSMRKETRPSLRKLAEGFIDGAKIGAGIAVACALLGMFTKMMVTTGAAQKMAGLVLVLSGGHLIVALVLTMLLSILLGCALPTVVAYVLVALIVSPVLVDMGLNQVIAHFFVFYYAILANVTPPVASATLVGSKIAGGSYMKASWESLKLSAPFYLVPYFIARNPIILSHSQPFFEATAAIVALLIACGGFMVFCQGYLLVKLNRVESCLALGAVLTAVFFGQYGGSVVLAVSVVLSLVLLIFQWRNKGRVLCVSGS
jgi:TRAP transporter 4TM/12TM fusion protein